MLALTLTLPLLLELSEVELVSDIVSDPEALTLPEKEALRLAVSSDVELCDTEKERETDSDCVGIADNEFESVVLSDCV